MGKVFINFIKVFFLFFAIQLVSASSDVKKAFFYSLAGAAIYLTLEKRISNFFKKKEENDENTD